MTNWDWGQFEHFYASYKEAHSLGFNSEKIDLFVNFLNIKENRNQILK